MMTSPIKQNIAVASAPFAQIANSAAVQREAQSLQRGTSPEAIKELQKLGRAAATSAEAKAQQKGATPQQDQVDGAFRSDDDGSEDRSEGEGTTVSKRRGNGERIDVEA